MKKLILGLSFLALIVCWSLPVHAQPEGELRIGLPTLYDQTFHPIWATIYRKQYIEPMYDYIVGVNKDGKFDPKQGVAYKWETSKDLLAWTFYIRDGVQFHNGDALTNADVKYTIEQAGTKKNNALARSDFMKKVERVETAAPDKVIVYLKEPWPTLLYSLSMLSGTEGMVQPKNYLEAKGDEYFRSHPIGSGPYKFIEWKEGVHIKFVAQDTHWRIGVPKYKYLTYKLIPEEGTRDAALRSGELDCIAVSLARAKSLTDAGFKIQQKKDGLFVGMMWLQDRKPEFATHKKKVRQALVYAINKKEIIDQILMGQGTLVGSAISMMTWAIEYKPYAPTPYDPQTAKKLLSEAGYPNGFTMYLYSFVTKLPETKLICEAMAGYWEAIGVKVKLLEMDYSAFKPVWTNKRQPPGPAAFILAWPNRPAYSWLNMYGSKALYSHKSDPKLDAMIAEHGKQTTTDGYIAAGQKMMDYVLENFYGTGICTTHELYAIGKNVPQWGMGKGVGSYRWDYIGKE